MAKASITIRDTEDGKITSEVEFEPKLRNDRANTTPAQAYMITLLAELVKIGELKVEVEDAENDG